ncbi:MAG: protein tyrosine phosphatase family protein [Burkholderiales bacterium]|nr:protein tyrosine phosphatase family protein [Burkholderiales bacterium]
MTDRSTVASIYKYAAISDSLATAGQPSEIQMAAVARDGFASVINLALHDDPRYSLPDEAALVQSLGMNYVHIPVPFDAPAEEHLLAFFDAMERHEGGKLLVHCAANIRVSSFLGLYRVMKKGEDEQAAFAQMRALWEPNPVWAAFIAAMLRKGAP